MCLGSRFSAEEGASGSIWDKLQEGTGEGQHRQTLWKCHNPIFVCELKKTNKLTNNEKIRITYTNIKGPFMYKGCSFKNFFMFGLHSNGAEN